MPLFYRRGSPLTPNIHQLPLCGLRCNYRARKAISNRQSPSPLFALESPKHQRSALPSDGAPPLSPIPFETVTHFATGKHLSDALLPPSPSPSPERKNGNTLFQSGVTKRPLLDRGGEPCNLGLPLSLAPLKDCSKLTSRLRSAMASQ